MFGNGIDEIQQEEVPKVGDQVEETEENKVTTNPQTGNVIKPITSVRDLKAIFETEDILPDRNFSASQRWCLVAGQLLTFLYCNGISKALVFDSQTFVSSVDTKLNPYSNSDLEPEFQVIEEIGKEDIDAARIETIYSKKGTLSLSYFNREKNRVEFTVYYIKRDSLTDEKNTKVDQVLKRKLWIGAGIQLKNVWGNQRYQLLHTVDTADARKEEIKVLRLQNNLLSTYPVSELNLFRMDGHPQTHKALNFDIYEKNEVDYKIYLTSTYIDFQDGKTKNFIYEHLIDYDAFQNTRLENERDLGEGCGSSIMSSHSLLVTACLESKMIRILERQNMHLFNSKFEIDLLENESFYEVTSLLPYSSFKPPFVHLISRMIHNYIVYVTYNESAKLYYVRVAEMIITKEQSDSNGTFEPETGGLEIEDLEKFDPFWNIVDEPLMTATVPFYIEKLADQFIARQDEGKAGFINLKPFCFLDQYLNEDGTCGQCPLGRYSLSMKSKTCVSCWTLKYNNSEMTAAEKGKLQYFCKYKIGQISSGNKGVYDVFAYPSDEIAQPDEIPENSQQDQEIVLIEEDSQVGKDDKVFQAPKAKIYDYSRNTNWSSALTVTVSILGFLFVLPWIFIAVCQIRKRIAANEVKNAKDQKQLQLLKISDYGREIRRQMRGPNGEDFQDPEGREQKFVLVDNLAEEQIFDDLKEIKKSQTTCAICVEDFKPNDAVRLTQCEHCFHSACIMTWAKSKIWANIRRIGAPQCPNCNASLTEKIYKPGEPGELLPDPEIARVLNSGQRQRDSGRVAAPPVNEWIAPPAQDLARARVVQSNRPANGNRVFASPANELIEPSAAGFSSGQYGSRRQTTDVRNRQAGQVGTPLNVIVEDDNHNTIQQRGNRPRRAALPAANQGGGDSDSSTNAWENRRRFQREVAVESEGYFSIGEQPTFAQERNLGRSSGQFGFIGARGSINQNQDRPIHPGNSSNVSRPNNYNQVAAEFQTASPLKSRAKIPALPPSGMSELERANLSVKRPQQMANTMLSERNNNSEAGENANEYMSQISGRDNQNRERVSAIGIRSQLQNKQRNLIHQSSHAASGDEAGGIKRRPTMQKAGQEILGQPQDIMSLHGASADINLGGIPRTVQNQSNSRAQSRQRGNPMLDPSVHESHPHGMVEEFKQEEADFEREVQANDIYTNHQMARSMGNVAQGLGRNYNIGGSIHMTHSSVEDLDDFQQRPQMPSNNQNQVDQALSDLEGL